MKTFVIGKREVLICGLWMVMAALLMFLAPKGAESIITMATERKLPIYCVQTDKKEIAITFDAAWGNSDTDLLLSLLKKHNAKATFFFTGEWVSKYPDDVLKIYAAGHECANHSDSHAHMESMSAEQLEADIVACNDKIKAITGTAPVLYRGPYGEYNNTSIEVCEKLKIFPIQWDCDSRDWQKRSSEEMTKSVCQNAKSGSILLFHNDTQNTPAALDKILEKLSKDGYKFVTVSDLIYKQNYYIRHDGAQIKKDG